MNVYIYGTGLGGRGGMETAIRSVYGGLRKLGHKTKVLLASESKDNRWEKDLDVVHFTKLIDKRDHVFFNENALLTHVMFLKRSLSQLSNPDVILTLGSTETAAARVAVEGMNPRPKIVSWVHFSLHVMKDVNWLRFADGHLAICRAIADQIQKVAPTIPVHIGYNPTNLSVPLMNRPSGTPHFIYIGRMANRQKRVDRLLHAVSQLTGDWKLTLIGDGPNLGELQALGQSLGIANKLEWTGWLDQPFSHIQHASALVLTSDYEGFGLVLIEALARGIPVISSNCPTGPSEIVTNGKNGYLFQPEDVGALKSLLQGIVNRAISLPTVEACRASVRKFSQMNVAKSIENALLRTLTPNLEPQVHQASSI